MSAILFPDLSISLNQHRWPCVLDPALALSDYGLPLVKQLGKFLDLWMAREFWHLIDHSYFLDRVSRELTTQKTETDSVACLPTGLSPQTHRTLQEWERLRLETDLGNQSLFWIGDGIGESLLSKDTDTAVIGRWERLARALDGQIEANHADLLDYAFRDAIALSAALGSAFILTHRSPADRARNLPPAIGSTLNAWGIDCREIDGTDSIVMLEREQLRQLFILAGVSKFLWTGLHPVVLHLVVPAAATLNIPPIWSEDVSSIALDDGPEFSREAETFWEGAKGFWYDL